MESSSSVTASVLAECDAPDFYTSKLLKGKERVNENSNE